MSAQKIATRPFTAPRSNSKARLALWVGLAIFSIMGLAPRADAQFTMPYFDDCEGVLNFTINPPVPVGGGVACGTCTVMPCNRSRAALRTTFQSHLPPGGNKALVLDSIHRGGATEWSTTLSLISLQDPADWNSLVGEHMGTATINIDTSGYTTLNFEFDFNFVITQSHHTLFTVEVNDGAGWTIVNGPLMNGPIGMMYVADECMLCPPACPGCGGIYLSTGWLHENIDLSAYTPGPGFQVRFRWIVRHSFDANPACGTSATAVLIDNIRMDGVTMGLVVSAAFPPPTAMVDADEIDINAMAFTLASVMQASTYDSITLTAAGTGDDMTDVADVRLYEDLDMSMTFTAGDTLLGASGGGFPTDNGDLVFMLPAPVSLASGQSRNYVAVMDLSGAASGLETFRVDVSDVNITSPPGANPAGVPRAGTQITVNAAGLTMSFGPEHPAMPGGIIGQSGAILGQLQFSTGGSACDVTEVQLDASGTGNDQLGVNQVRLVLENVGTRNGRVDPGEPVLAMNSYAADNGTRNFILSMPIQIGIGAPQYLLVVYDFSAVAAMPGTPETYCFEIDAIADIVTTAASTVIMGGALTSCATVTDMCPRTLCGDCNRDGILSIIDALIGAQHAALLLMPPLSGEAFSNCNVTGPIEPSAMAQVNILDALVIAQLSAMLTPPFMCC